MADKEIVDLTSQASPATTDVVEMQRPPGGAGTSFKVLLSALKTLFSQSPTLVTPALGTPASGVLTNCTGTAAGLTAGNVTTNANLTGDVTSSGNATTLATVNGNVGSFTSANLTVNAKGLVTAAANGSGGGATAFTSLTDVPSSYSGAGLKIVRVNTGATGLEFVTPSGGGNALTSDPLSQFAATTSLQLKGVMSDETGSGALVFADTPTLVTPVLGAAIGTSLQLSGLTASLPVKTDASKNLSSGAINLASATEVTGVIPYLINAQTGTTYTVVAGDNGKLVTFSNASPVAVTLPQATGSFTTGWSAVFLNLGAGAVTITPTTSTHDGAATVVLQQYQSASAASDGANWQGTFGGKRITLTTTGSSGAATLSAAGVLNVPQYTGGSGGGAPGLPSGRLTLTTGVPVTTSDVTGATNIYYTPCVGNTLPLWDGAAWASTAFTQVTLALGTLSSGKPYDVFGFLNTGALNTELLAWTDGTTRATAITLQDGMYCKSGDHTRLYLGTFYTTATTTTEDSVLKRFVWNMYNRDLRLNQKSDSSSHSYGSATARSWNNDATVQTQCVLGLAAAVSTKLKMQVSSNSTTGGSNSAVYGIWDWTSGTGVDGDAAGYLAFTAPITPTLVAAVIAGSSTTVQLAVGYHYLRGVEAEFGANAGSYDRILLTADVMG